MLVGTVNGGITVGEVVGSKTGEVCNVGTLERWKTLERWDVGTFSDFEIFKFDSNSSLIVLI